jgi:signal transduction histidine kinase/ligand-binding sensor domain-containing protein
MLACLAALQIALSAIDSTPRPISQLVHTTWTARDGAPTDIIDIAQTSDGYLWLGTRSGLVRFDGVRFVPLAPLGGDTIPSGGIRRLLGTRDGSLWIVWLSGGVSRLRDGRLRSYGEQDGLSMAVQLTESSTGMLVAGMRKGLALFEGGRWRDVSREWQYPGTESQTVLFDREDALWAQTENRIVYRLASGEGFLDPGFRVTGRALTAKFAQAQDGTMWMAQLGRGAHTIPRVNDTEPVSELIIGAWTLLFDRKGSLWIGTGGDGLRRVVDPARIRGRKIGSFSREAEHFTQKDGLQSDIVYAMLEDREGNVWVGTTRGLERFREGAFTPIVTPGSVRARYVYATRDSSVLSATQNVFAVFRLRAGRQDTLPVGRDTFVTDDLFEDSSRVLWSVTPTGVLRWRGRQFAPIRLRHSDAQRLTDITVDRAGIWVFDEALGLLRLSGDSLIQVAQLPPPAARGTLHSDRQGRIWISQPNRVALYDRRRLRLFGPADGVGSGVFGGVFEDRSGTIWAVTDGGISRFESGRFRKLTPRQLAGGRAIYGVAEDDEGAWWIATDREVRRLPRGELDRAIADSAYTVRYRGFGALDGLPGMIIKVQGGSIITRGADGRIWVATDSVLASVDPRRLPTGPAPPVLIEAVRIGDRELAPSEAMRIPPRSRDLQIDYTATSLSTPERVQFRYRLDGEDHTWRDVGTRRSAYYTGLAPGTYRFRVIASNGDGVWNEQGAGLSFRVLPAWYQAAWFRVCVILLIGGIGAIAAALVQRRRHLRSQEALRSQYEATLAERARIAQDLHDTLLQGFAGVTLQLKTAELALPEQPDVAAETILRVQRLARESLREARERVWDMRDTGRAGDLPAALAGLARERTAGTGIEVAVATTGEGRRLTRGIEDAAFRIGREAIGNAVRHAAARRIEINVEFGATTFRLEVRDDGRGFTLQDAEEARRNGHFGLSGARERAARMGGVCEVRPRLEGGTVVAVELPLDQPETR